MQEAFKRCNCCDKHWKDRDTFLNDSTKKLLGYQVNFADLKLGLLLFNCKCGNTMAVDVGTFSDLYKGPVFKERKTGSAECPGFCLREDELEPCPAKCECAYVREILQIVK